MRRARGKFLPKKDAVHVMVMTLLCEVIKLSCPRITVRSGWAPVCGSPGEACGSQGESESTTPEGCWLCSLMPSGFCWVCGNDRCLRIRNRIRAVLKHKWGRGQLERQGQAIPASLPWAAAGFHSKHIAQLQEQWFTGSVRKSREREGTGRTQGKQTSFDLKV